MRGLLINMGLTKEQYKELSNKVDETITPLKKENIKQLRELVKLFIGISAAIVGFTIPVFGDSSLVQNSTLLIGGLFMFLIIVAYGLHYLKNILQLENNDLATLEKFYKEALEIGMLGTNEEFSIKMNEINSYHEKIKKEDQRYVFDILIYTFFIGLILVILSMTDLTQLFVWLGLGILSLILLVVYFRKRNAVWGGLTIGVIVGLVIATVFLFKGNGFDWFTIGKSAIVGTLLGFLAELIGEFSRRLKK